MGKIILIVVIMALLSGCGHVVSKELIEIVDKDLTTAALFKDPDVHKGKIVMLGGVIASSKILTKTLILKW